jgi:hypothetical protein
MCGNDRHFWLCMHCSMIFLLYGWHFPIVYFSSTPLAHSILDLLPLSSWLCFASDIQLVGKGSSMRKYQSLIISTWHIKRQPFDTLVHQRYLLLQNQITLSEQTYYLDSEGIVTHSTMVYIALCTDGPIVPAKMLAKHKSKSCNKTRNKLQKQVLETAKDPNTQTPNTGVWRPCNPEDVLSSPDC